MAEPFVGEIRIFAGNFAPLGWAFCEGQLLNKSDYETLFTLISTTYGGDGTTTFALPDLRGRVPIHFCPGFALAARGGAEQVTLAPGQIPAHSHAFMASTGGGSAANPSNNVLATSPSIALYQPFMNTAVNMSPAAVGSSGGSQAHSNMQPFQCVNFIIALFGLYPSRS